MILGWLLDDIKRDRPGGGAADGHISDWAELDRAGACTPMLSRAVADQRVW